MISKTWKTYRISIDLISLYIISIFISLKWVCQKCNEKLILLMEWHIPIACVWVMLMLSCVQEIIWINFIQEKIQDKYIKHAYISFSIENKVWFQERQRCFKSPRKIMRYDIWKWFILWVPFHKKKPDLSQKKFYCLFNVVLRSDNIYLDKMQKW